MQNQNQKHTYTVHIQRTPCPTPGIISKEWEIIGAEWEQPNGETVTDCTGWKYHAATAAAAVAKYATPARAAGMGILKAVCIRRTPAANLNHMNIITASGAHITHYPTRAKTAKAAHIAAAVRFGRCESVTLTD